MTRNEKNPLHSILSVLRQVGTNSGLDECHNLCEMRHTFLAGLPIGVDMLMSSCRRVMDMEAV